MPPATITVLIVDDDLLVREYLSDYIDSAEDLVLAGTCTTGEQAVATVKSSPPDVVLMDLRMPGMDGFEATRTIHDISPTTKVLALTTYAEDEAAASIIDHGGVGFLAKSTRAPTILNAIRAAHAGITVLPTETARRFAASQVTPPPPELSARERRILAALADGLTNAAISRRLFVSLSTVKSDIAGLMRKLNATSRSQVVAKATHLRILD